MIEYIGDVTYRFGILCLLAIKDEDDWPSETHPQTAPRLLHREMKQSN